LIGAVAIIFVPSSLFPLPSSLPVKYLLPASH
jgi:hypothetical protein